MNIALSNFIALARWVAALAVLLGHAGVLIEISDIMIARHGPGVYLWWFFAAFCRYAVMIFFVISGFLIGGEVLRKAQSTDRFLGGYLLRRFSRIYVVFVPALLFGFVIDLFGRTFFPHTGVYDLPLFDGIFNPLNLLWALLQQQSIYAPMAGSNGPLWSLACEMWYYLTFPLLLLPMSNAYSERFRLWAFVCGACAAILLSLPESFFAFGYGVWALGAFTRIAPRPVIRSTLLSLALFLVTVTIARLGARGPLVAAYPIVVQLADAAVAMTFANVLLALRFAPERGLFSRLGGVHCRLSDFSYSLYATHAPLVFFAWAAVGGALGPSWYKELPTPLHWTLEFALLASAIIIAFIFSRFTEARTDEFRSFLRRRADWLLQRKDLAQSATIFDERPQAAE